jgi:hypothetical protein
MDRLNETLGKDQIEDISNKLKELNSDYKNNNISQSMKIFFEIIIDDNFMGNLITFSKYLKYSVESGLVPHRKERDELLEIISNNKSSPENKKQAEEKKNQLFIKIHNKSFSYEYMVRELYHIRTNLPDSQESLYFKQLVMNLKNTGNPFEIIDGDNLNFISNFYPELFSNDDSEIFVFSIIGPQSSGKSTLLNFLFGTQFASSSGRCTKGVYGAVMNVRCNDKNIKLLILDTEGIQAAERGDETFDKRLFLFCLSISNVTIICNKGDINQKMIEILKLTLNVMSELKEQKVNNPELFVVLNALPEANEEKLWEPINQLNDDLIKSNPNISEHFNLTRKNVVLLPTAFNTVDIFKKLDVKANLPSDSFSKKCLDLRNLILSTKLSSHGMTLSTWFSLAQSLWDKTYNLRHLYNYSSLEELKVDANLKEEIQKMVENMNSEFKKPDDYIPIYNNSNEVLQNFENQIKLLKDQISRDFYIKVDTMQEEFENFCKPFNVSEILLKKRTVFLRQNCNSILIDRTKEIEKTMNNLKNKALEAGDTSMNQIIADIKNKNSFKPLDLDTANLEFEKFWNEVELKSAIENLSSHDEIREECFKIIKTYYTSNTDKVYYDLNTEKTFQEYFKTSNIDSKFISYLSGLSSSNKLYLTTNVTPRSSNALEKYNKSNLSYVKFDHNLIEKRKTYSVKLINPLEAFSSQGTDKFKIIASQAYFLKTGGFFPFYIKTDASTSEKKDEFKKLFIYYLNQFESKSSKIGLRINDSEFILNEIENSFENFLGQKYKDNDKLYYLNKWANNVISFILNNISIDKNSYNEKIESSSDLVFWNTSKLIKYFMPKKESEFQRYQSMENCVGTKESVDYNTSYEIKNHRYQSFIDWHLSRTPSPNIDKNLSDSGNEMFSNSLKIDAIFVSLTKLACGTLINSKNELDYFSEINTLIKAIETDENIPVERYIQVNPKNIGDFAVNKVDQLIISINQDLKESVFQLNQTFIGILHQITLVLLWNMYAWIEIYKSRAVIRQTNEKKKIQQEIFISQLTDDTEAQDTALSHELFELINSNLSNHFYNSAIECYEKEMNDKNSKYRSENSMKWLDWRMQNENLDEETIIKIITDPLEILKEAFEQYWKKDSESTLIKVLDSWNYNMGKNIKSLSDYFKNFENELLLSGNWQKMSIDIFKINLKNFNEKNDQEGIIMKELDFMKEKLFIYFIETFVGKWENFEVERDSYLISSNLPIIKKIHLDFHIKKESVLHNVKTRKINSLKNIIEKLYNMFSNYLLKFSENQPNEVQLDKQNFRKSFQENFIGCNAFCELCMRKCDRQHKNQDNHKCSSGHRFKVFCGSKLEGSNHPSFISCNMMNDENIIKYNSKYIIKFR